MRVIRVVFALILLLVLVIQTRPATYRVERSATISAPDSAVYGRIADFHRWGEWSPWEGRDPHMTRDYSGAANGPGAAYHWAGNDQVGEGRMTITDAEPNRKLAIRLEFLKPFASVSTTTFTLAPDGSGTKVTWDMEGRNNFVSKAMSLFSSMDKMVGPDFEKGLAGLKSKAESDTSHASPAAS